MQPQILTRTVNLEEVSTIASSPYFPNLQMVSPIPDFLAAQVMYVRVPFLTSSVSTDKQHAHKLYFNQQLLTF